MKYVQPPALRSLLKTRSLQSVLWQVGVGWRFDGQSIVKPGKRYYVFQPGWLREVRQASVDGSSSASRQPLILFTGDVRQSLLGTFDQVESMRQMTLLPEHLAATGLNHVPPQLRAAQEIPAHEIESVFSSSPEYPLLPPIASWSSIELRCFNDACRALAKVAAQFKQQRARVQASLTLPNENEHERSWTLVGEADRAIQIIGSIPVPFLLPWPRVNGPGDLRYRHPGRSCELSSTRHRSHRIRLPQNEWITSAIIDQWRRQADDEKKEREKKAKANAEESEKDNAKEQEQDDKKNDSVTVTNIASSNQSDDESRSSGTSIPPPPYDVDEHLSWYGRLSHSASVEHLSSVVRGNPWPLVCAYGPRLEFEMNLVGRRVQHLMRSWNKEDFPYSSHWFPGRRGANSIEGEELMRRVKALDAYAPYGLLSRSSWSDIFVSADSTKLAASTYEALSELLESSFMVSLDIYHCHPWPMAIVAPITPGWIGGFIIAGNDVRF